MSELKFQQATLGGGCFWCVEAVLQQVRGVVGVVSGYSGGMVDSPSYRAVCSGGTGHAEVIQVTFDPAAISFRAILEVFFSAHDPTTPNRQGADVGTQYRSVIFYHDDEQKRVAEMLIEHLNAEKLFPRPIVTEVSPLEKFFPAEDYHQNYYQDNPEQGYCQAVIAPKLAKFRKHLAATYGKSPPA